MLDINSNIGVEEQLLILTSRISLTQAQEEEVKNVLNGSFNINRFIALAVKHKVLPLVGQHLIRLDQNNLIDFQNKRLMQYYYLGNKEKNNVLFQELKTVLQAFRENNILAIPLKGCLLIPNLYEDYGLRIMNDIDFLIPNDNKGLVSKTVQSLGYQIGDYSWATDSIILAPRKEVMLFGMYAGNLYTHVKKIDNPFVKSINIDFSYDVDLERDYTASKGLIQSSVGSKLLNVSTNILNNVDFLIHLAIHLFKEANNAERVLIKQDLNLIKFCDLREYIMRNREGLNWEFIVERSRELNAQKALYYSLLCTKIIYNDDYIDSCLNVFSKGQDYSLLNKEEQENFMRKLFSL